MVAEYFQEKYDNDGAAAGFGRSLLIHRLEELFLPWKS